MIRVLICDDAVAFSMIVRHWLSSCDDIDVVGIALSGAQGLEMTSSLAPDVVVLDHLLYDVPEGSERLGPELRAAQPGVGIVLVSGMPAAELAAVANRAGADTFVSKATTSHGMCEAVRQAAQPTSTAPDGPPLTSA